MKMLIVLFIFLFVPNHSFAQRLFFKQEVIDSIIISSNIAAYQFDDHGTTKGVYDEYRIGFDTINSIYAVCLYQRDTYTTTFSPSAVHVKTQNLLRKNTVDTATVRQLILALEQPYVLPQFENLSYPKADFYAATSRKSVLRLAKKVDQDWRFKLKYATKEMADAFFKGCAQIDTFNLFLSNEFHTGDKIFLNDSNKLVDLPIVTDYDDHFHLRIVTTNQAYRFSAKYPNTFKQPWYFHPSTFSFEGIPQLNFDINRQLCILLPEHFSRLETLQFNGLIYSYLRWCLERKGNLN